MKYKIRRTFNCNFYNGHFYHVGQKVKVNIDKVCEYYKSHNSRLAHEGTYRYMESIRDTEFIISWIETQPYLDNDEYIPAIFLDGFPHILEVDDLILIKEV